MTCTDRPALVSDHSDLDSSTHHRNLLVDLRVSLAGQMFDFSQQLWVEELVALLVLLAQLHWPSGRASEHQPLCQTHE